MTAMTLLLAAVGCLALGQLADRFLEKLGERMTSRRGTAGLSCSEADRKTCQDLE